MELIGYWVLIIPGPLFAAFHNRLWKSLGSRQFRSNGNNTVPPARSSSKIFTITRKCVSRVRIFGDESWRMAFGQWKILIEGPWKIVESDTPRGWACTPFSAGGRDSVEKGTRNWGVISTAIIQDYSSSWSLFWAWMSWTQFSRWLFWTIKAWNSTL